VLALAGTCLCDQEVECFPCVSREIFSLCSIRWAQSLEYQGLLAKNKRHEVQKVEMVSPAGKKQRAMLGAFEDKQADSSRTDGVATGSQ